MLQFSREKKGERYIKHFDVYQHLTVIVMFYAVIKIFESLREITDYMFPEARKLAHLGINMMLRRSTLFDANARRPEAVFELSLKNQKKMGRRCLKKQGKVLLNPPYFD